MAAHTHRPPNWLEHCKQAYCYIVGGPNNPVRSKHDLLRVFQHTGRNPNEKTMNVLWPKSTKIVTYDEYLDMCYSIPVTTMEDLVQAFKTMDTSGDGFISTTEFLEAMSTGAEAISRKDLLALLRNADADKDGKLNYKEFAEMMTASVDKLIYLTAKKKLEASREMSGGHSTKSSPTKSKKVVSVICKEQTPAASDSGQQDSNAQFSLQKQLEFRKPNSVFIVPTDWASCQRSGCLLTSETSDVGELRFTCFELSLEQDMSVYLSLTVKHNLIKPELSVTDSLHFLVIGSETIDTSWWNATEGASEQLDLVAGTYQIVPIYSGAHFTQPPPALVKKSATLVRVDKSGRFKLTDSANTVVQKLFTLYDSDADGLMSKDDFCRFASQTYDKTDPETLWEAVKEFSTLRAGQLTFDEFKELFLHEIQEDEGRPDCLWNALECSGFNRQLELTKNIPFCLIVRCDATKQSKLKIRAMPLTMYKALALESQLCDWVLLEGQPLKRKQTSSHSPKEEDYRIVFHCSSNFVLLAIEKLKKAKKYSKLTFGLNFGVLDLVPMMDNLLDPKISVKREMNSLVFDVVSTGSERNLLFYGVLPDVINGVSCDVSVRFH
ncbi:hypothetical protein EG68_07417 [Paragonimus skrjabini miyazakii]|uniref:EF-hand domain-containing protein n=1 Tax=Paragonimus skrjabini miyazakii TaxID=59628 RepID=A0A8S9YMG5_9TREM|nr:hypothetical protein EG68_07417 [Paragonimus skrjabini miyazakii]